MRTGTEVCCGTSEQFIAAKASSGIIALRKGLRARTTPGRALNAEKRSLVLSNGPKLL